MNRTILTITILFLAFSCAKKEEEVPAATNIATGIVTNLNSVASTFTPTSLSTTSTSSSLMSQEPGSFESFSDEYHAAGTLCTGVSFSECQARLLKTYLAFGKSLVQTTSAFVSGIGAGLGQVADGATGSTVTSSGYTVAYSKTTTSSFSFLATKNSSALPMLYLNVNSNVYTLKVDGNQGETASDFKVSSVVTYTDSSTWTVDLLIEKAACDTTDVQAPSKVKIHLVKQSGLWTGKAMLYIPRWVDGTSTATCSTTPSVANSLMFYTDFVGNDTATRAALHFIPITNATTSYGSNFGLDQLCTNFAGVCTANSLTGGALAAFANPICSTAVSTSVTYSDSCSASDTIISGAAFGLDSLWTAPSGFLGEVVSLPTSI